MTQHFKGFDPAADKCVGATKDLYDKAAVVAKESATALTEIVDMAWNSTKMLNDKMAENLASNIAAAFEAGREIAAAKSLMEVGKLQAELVQRLATQTTEQTREFVDLSTHASQQVLEKIQALVWKTFTSFA
jgi:hypothetical protein